MPMIWDFRPDSSNTAWIVEIMTFTTPPRFALSSKMERFSIIAFPCKLMTAALTEEALI